jgi:hypothetical protein
MSKLQKLQKNNDLLNEEIEKIKNEKIKCDKDIKAMTREKAIVKSLYLNDIKLLNKEKNECQKKLTVVKANAELHIIPDLLDRIERLKEENKQLEKEVNQLKEEEISKPRTYHSSVSHHRRSNNRSRINSRSDTQSSIKGGKTNKKKKSKRKHTRKRF